MKRLLVLFACAFAVLGASLSYGQENGGGSLFLPNQEVRVASLPSLTAPSTHRYAVLATALEIVVHDKAVCCGKDSDLADAAVYAEVSNPLSLQELSGKLQGRHLSSDGRAIVVNSEYVSESGITADFIVRTLLEQRALLFEWKGHVYVLYGSLFNEVRDYSGAREFTVVRLFLIDPRFSDERREVVFDRESDDLKKVQGILGLRVATVPSPWK